MKQRAKVVRDIVLTCVVLHNMRRTHQGGLDRATTPADGIAAIANEPVQYMHDKNCRNALREAKYQQDLLTDYFSHVGALVGSYSGSEM